MEQMFNVNKSEYDCIFDCDYTKIPEKGTLVAIETASRGLVNVITTGNYSFRKIPYDIFSKLNEEEGYEVCNQKGKFLVSVEVKYPESTTTNSRFLDDLYFPVLKREES